MTCVHDRTAPLPFLCAVALILGFLSGPLAPHHALAAFTTCRSDPAVLLSNGGALDLQAGISDSASDVKDINYTVHIPRGLRVVAVLNTDSILGLVEHVTVYADNSANTFTTTTVVNTGVSGVQVTASSSAVSALNLTLGVASASGMNGQTLTTRFSALL